MSEPGQRYHHGNLRAAFLARAEIKLSRGGVHALSRRELARDVSVSHGAPREHFRNKQALLDALAETRIQRLRRELEAAMTALRAFHPGDAIDLGWAGSSGRQQTSTIYLVTGPAD